MSSPTHPSVGGAPEKNPATTAQWTAAKVDDDRVVECECNSGEVDTNGG